MSQFFRLSHNFLKMMAKQPFIALLPSQTDTGDSVQKQLLQKLMLHKFDKNSLIFLQHSQVQSLYFLLDGTVNCYRQLPNGQECLIQTYHANPEMPSLINESVLWRAKSILADQSENDTPHSEFGDKTAFSHAVSTNLQLLINDASLHQLTAKASHTCVIATLPVTDYFYYIQKFELGALFTWFAEQMSVRLYKHLISSDLLTFKSAKAKLAYYILTNFAPDKDFTFLGSQKQLAGQLGLRPETLNRTLHELINDGLLLKQENQYQIANIEQLLILVSE